MSVLAVLREIRFMKTIILKEMTHPMHVSYFLRQLGPQLAEEKLCVSIMAKQILPAACVPICGIIDTLREQGKQIKCVYPEASYLANIHFNKPYLVSEHKDSLAFPFSKIWKFNDFSEVTLLVNAYADEIAASISGSSGLIEGIEWSLNEAMDNVLQHSGSGVGYIMGVLHKTTNYIMFSLFDNGQGIYNSLRNSEYHPRNAIDAISLSIQEGKTRDHSIGQGNGLWGLYNIVRNNKGRLSINSHGSSLVLYDNGKLKKFEDLPLLNTKNATTTVNMYINYSNDISVVDALGGYTPADIRYENKLDDDNCLIFTLSEESNGYGTRIAGERVRNKVINHFLRTDPPSRVLIDFAGVSMISSSFADEFIGKLLVQWGFCRFINTVQLCNLSPTIEMIINRSVSQRMSLLFPTNN